ASGMNAIIQAFRSIRAGDAHLVLAGGMESMSQAPYLLMGARKGLKFGSQTMIDSLQHDGLYCSLCHGSMGVTAENVAKKYAISRPAQDRYALSSHQKAILAQEHNAFANEIIEMAELKADEGPRKDTSLEKLASLKAVFKDGGTVTAGNASTINDGAALALLASEKAVQAHQLKPTARIIDYVFVGLKPELMGMGPKIGIEKLLKKNSLSLEKIDLFEINEAFASQVLAVIQELKINASKVNIYGGAIAFGHPLGMSGARIVGTLITGLKQTKGKLGIAALCVGGGQGAAVLLENI
ncbi:MAG: thiolase family protein, partial [Patescibacteria group bacterium]